MTLALSGCAAIRSPKPDPAAPTPGRSSSPSVPPPASPSDAPTEKLPTADTPPMGLDVRYVDKNGNFKTLRVEDFPK